MSKNGTVGKIGKTAPTLPIPTNKIPKANIKAFFIDSAPTLTRPSLHYVVFRTAPQVGGWLTMSIDQQDSASQVQNDRSYVELQV
ncbi:MAG: hypothetical protein KAH30_02720 [Caldisericia bacterium]|nr:hypothetical protein [Caldisericia bacterium]